MTRTAVLVRLYAALLAAAGAALLFVPDLAGPGAGIAGQLAGAGLLGFATANWTGRGLVLGGVYGRALVAGNQAFAVVGTLVLVQHVAAEPALPAAALLGVLAFGAVLYSALLYRSPGVQI